MKNRHSIRKSKEKKAPLQLYKEHGPTTKKFIHPLCHIINGERLYYVLLNLKGSVETSRSRLINSLTRYDLFNSACIYHLFGQSDILIRVWSPPEVFKKFEDDLDKSEYTTDKIVFLVGEIDTWYQREIERNEHFWDDLHDTTINNIITNSANLPHHLRCKQQVNKNSIHFYIFLDGAVTLAEDTFTKIKSKLNTKSIRAHIKETAIERISLYSYSTEERRGVLLKAEVKTYTKSSEGLAKLARLLKPIAGKTHTFVCQGTGINQKDELFPVESLHGLESSHGRERLGWKDHGKAAKSWPHTFTSCLLETQEFDEKYFQDQKRDDTSHANADQFDEVKELIKQFHAIVSPHAVDIAKAYKLRPVRAKGPAEKSLEQSKDDVEERYVFDEDWWKLIFDLRKLYKWTAMKNNSRLRAFYMSKFVVFEKILRDSIIPILEGLNQRKRTERKRIAEEFKKLETKLKEVVKLSEDPQKSNDRDDKIGQIINKFVHFLGDGPFLTELSSSEKQAEGESEVGKSAVYEAKTITLWTIKEVLGEIIKLCGTAQCDHERDNIVELQALLLDWIECRNDLMHGKVDSYFNKATTSGIANWSQVMTKYLRFRLRFPVLLVSLQNAVITISAYLRKPAT